MKVHKCKVHELHGLYIELPKELVEDWKLKDGHTIYMECSNVGVFLSRDKPLEFK